MTVKTTSRINSESIEVTLTQRDIAQLAHDKLIKARPDLEGKQSISTLIIKNFLLFGQGDGITVKVDVQL